MLFLVLIVTACSNQSGRATSSPDPSPTVKSFAQEAHDALLHLDGVAEVNADGPPSGQSSVEVVMRGTATEVQTVAIAEATRRFAKDASHDEPVEATVTIRGPDMSAVDSTSANAVQFEVFPKPWKSAAVAAGAVMAVRKIPGVTSIAITGVFPAVEVSDVTVMEYVLTRVRDVNLWKDGGTVRTAGGRVRITDLPGQLSQSTISAVIEQASRFSDGQFSIEAARTGPSAPALYVDRVTIDDSHAIEAAFLSVIVKDGDQKTYPVPFFIRAAGPSGSMDTSGLIPGARL